MCNSPQEIFIYYKDLTFIFFFFKLYYFPCLVLEAQGKEKKKKPKTYPYRVLTVLKRIV